MVIQYIAHRWEARGRKKKERHERGKKESRESSGKVGERKKYICFGGDHSARPCHRQPLCRCYNVQKVPVAHDLEQLEYGCQGSPWSGQVGER